MLSDIANKIQQSKFHWSDVALNIGIDKNDIFKIKRKNDSTLEFVPSVTQKIWEEIFNFVGLNLSDNDFTEISSVSKYNGADVNVKNEDGRTAIDLVGRYNHHDIVELLKSYK